MEFRKEEKFANRAQPPVLVVWQIPGTGENLWKRHCEVSVNRHNQHDYPAASVPKTDTGAPR